MNVSTERRSRAYRLSVIVLVSTFVGGTLFLLVTGSLAPHEGSASVASSKTQFQPTVWDRAFDEPTLVLLRLGLVAALAFGIAGLAYRAAVGRLAFRMGPFALEDYAEKSADESLELAASIDRIDRDLDARMTRLESLVEDLAEATAGDVEALEDRIRTLGDGPPADGGEG